MWIFAPLGLLMPAAIPATKVDPKYLGPKGDFDLQVRARAVSHLENFIRDYAEPLGLEYSEIQVTPEMDYNCRIYMRKADFAVAVAQMVLDIDYRKFKPTAEDKNEDGTPRYREGKEYHSVLNAIWGTVCSLGKPGGKWGPYSQTNPNGYVPGRWRGATDYLDTAWGRAYRAPERTLFDEIGTSWTDSTTESVWGTEWEYPEDDSYVPDSTDRMLNVLYEVDDLPARDWPDWLTKEELDLVRSQYEFRLSQETKTWRKNRKGRRSNRKNTLARKGL